LLPTDTSHSTSRDHALNENSNRDAYVVLDQKNLDNLNAEWAQLTFDEILEDGVSIGRLS
jgi:hypothetical protein